MENITKIVPVSSILMPINDMLRQFEPGKQEKDTAGNLIKGKGDKAYLTFFERKVSMEKELTISGYANHTPIMVYEGRKGATVEIAEGVVETEGKYIVVDGMQRTGTALQIGIDTPVQIQIVSEGRAREMMISAGYHRKQNSPAQFTKILRADITSNPEVTVDTLCKRYSMSDATIKRFLDILTLPTDITDKIGDTIPLHVGVALADKIKRLGKGDKAIIDLLVLSAIDGKDQLEKIAGEISAKAAANKLARKNIVPVYKGLEPVYNAERARIIKAQIDNGLEELPESDFFKGQSELWNFIHGVSSSDCEADKAKWETLHPVKK
jgi:hypothetical protein